jgi:hypothetical protein
MSLQHVFVAHLSQANEARVGWGKFCASPSRLAEESIALRAVSRAVAYFVVYQSNRISTIHLLSPKAISHLQDEHGTVPLRMSAKR